MMQIEKDKCGFTKNNFSLCSQFKMLHFRFSLFLVEKNLRLVNYETKNGNKSNIFSDVTW